MLPHAFWQLPPPHVWPALHATQPAPLFPHWLVDWFALWMHAPLEQQPVGHDVALQPLPPQLPAEQL